MLAFIEVLFIIACIIVVFGVLGVWCRRLVLLLVLLSLEVVMLGVVIGFASVYALFNIPEPLFYIICIISLAASDAIAVLSIFVAYYYVTGDSVFQDDSNFIRFS